MGLRFHLGAHENLFITTILSLYWRPHAAPLLLPFPIYSQTIKSGQAGRPGCRQEGIFGVCKPFAQTGHLGWHGFCRGRQWTVLRVEFGTQACPAKQHDRQTMLTTDIFFCCPLPAGVAWTKVVCRHCRQNTWNRQTCLLPWHMRAQKRSTHYTRAAWLASTSPPIPCSPPT